MFVFVVKKKTKQKKTKATYTFSTNIRINKINGFCLQIQGTKRSGHQKQFFQYKLYCISNNKTGSESLTTKILLVHHEQFWLAKDSQRVGWRVWYLFSSVQHADSFNLRTTHNLLRWIPILQNFFLGGVFCTIFFYIFLHNQHPRRDLFFN